MVISVNTGECIVNRPFPGFGYTESLLFADVFLILKQASTITKIVDVFHYLRNNKSEAEKLQGTAEREEIMEQIEITVFPKKGLKLEYFDAAGNAVAASKPPKPF